MPVSGAPVAGAKHLHHHARGGVFRRGQRMRLRDAAVVDRQLALADCRRKAGDELRPAAGIDAVGDPDDLGVTGRIQETGDGRQHVDALDRKRLRRQLTQRNAGIARRHQRDVALRLRHRDQRHAAAVGLRGRDQFIRRVDAGLPACRGGPAVIDQHDERRARARCARDRIVDRAGRSEDHQRRGEQPDQRQPPRRARGRLFLRRDVEQQPRRRKIDPARARRHQPQQPPQHRQADQPDQHQRLRKGDGKAADHAWRPIWLPLLTVMPPCRNNSSSAAERSVLCTENSQPRRRVSARISSLCRATRAM